ncbi:hypothetical protein G6F37_008953 [Rhizopus arrhizus]|nr:hypothetical protein G6F38_009004 [Rhizopus arrhizus]KAG1154983.1 hypothetical protein G6F37_008953 [Rhizopus arrhizus]
MIDSMSRALLISLKTCTTRSWILFIRYDFIWPIDSHPCHPLELYRYILQLDHHRIAVIVQERQQTQIQPIPKSLRAGEKGRFDDQNNIALLPPTRADEIVHFAIAVNDVVDKAKV